jgi:hypothetical protein
MEEIYLGFGRTYRLRLHSLSVNQARSHQEARKILQIPLVILPFNAM